MNLAFLIPKWNTPARLQIPPSYAPLPSPKFWESWAQHPQISRKLLILKDFPMPKIKKPFWAQHPKKRQSIDFKRVFFEILGIVTIRIYSTLAYIVRPAIPSIYSTHISFNSHHLQIKMLAKS